MFAFVHQPMVRVNCITTPRKVHRPSPVRDLRRKAPRMADLQAAYSREIRIYLHHAKAYDATLWQSIIDLQKEQDAWNGNSIASDCSFFICEDTFTFPLYPIEVLPESKVMSSDSQQLVFSESSNILSSDSLEILR